MAKYLQIQIPNSCHESWDAMSGQHDGKFCYSCQKNVIDFTIMSNEQLIVFFKNNNSKVCGKFTSDQLNTDIPVSSKKIPWLKYILRITIPAFLFSLKSAAQDAKFKEQIQLFNFKNIPVEPPGEDLKENIVKGKIIDESGNPLPSATIIVKNTKRGTVSDADGNFSIKVNQNDASLFVTYIGYEAKEIKVNFSGEKRVILEPIATLHTITLGMVVTSHRTISKKKKIKNNPVCINRNPVIIFPNPVSSASKLNIKWSNPVTADQTIEIYNQSGILFQTEIVQLEKNTTVQNFDLRQLIPGVYIVKIIDNKTHQSSSQQFLVQ